MGIIKAFKLGFDYLKYDEDGNVQDTQRAVNDVNLDIEAGQFVAVLGHNGSGKSTLAKHLNALLLPTEGTLWVDGIDNEYAKAPEELARMVRETNRIVVDREEILSDHVYYYDREKDEIRIAK